ncbi:class I SAM-dependent methyltransferase [Actinacidiphila yeochonensis]|uniref:class I SAM-dependent methyltransferase n=1 Tax=Actinacidiphila yeochonensis TaxID=89050 RepID=UPI000B225CB7|nr:class I SAM-dependent methyltransferase [Actinacidiphila yeochonensis]
MGDFDAYERRMWQGKAAAFEASSGLLCAHTVPEVLAAAGIGPGVRVLDVGTGTGTAARAAVRLGAEVTAVDAEPSMVARAAEAVPEAAVRQAVLPELPFADGSFDAVVANFVLNHVGRPATALAELLRVLRPGGSVALTVWTSPRAAGQELISRALAAAGAVHPSGTPAGLAADEDFPRTEAGLGGLLSAAGFADAAARTLAWDHLADPEVWWSGLATGIGLAGSVLSAQPAPVAAEVRRRYDELAVGFRTPEGLLALPHTAVLGWAVRPA